MTPEILKAAAITEADAKFVGGNRLHAPGEVAVRQLACSLRTEALLEEIRDLLAAGAPKPTKAPK